MGKYVQSSIDYLYPGLLVSQPIYNADMSLLLVAEGTVLGEDQISKLKTFNEGSRISVSDDLANLLLQKREALIGIHLTQELEDEVGYTGIKQGAIDILEKISHEETLSPSELSSVSEELSHTVEVTAPSIIVELVCALASADEYLQRHCVNVGMLNGLLGKWLGLPKETVDALILVGLLHDCGKASIPSKILTAPRPLTGIEYEVIKTHPVFSNSLMSDFPETAQLAARGHHEKINGGGYPDGLSGEDIPFMARITAVSDIYDAMVSRRSYKSPNSPFKILSIVKSLRDSELDGKLVDVFINCMANELVGKQVMLTDGRLGIVASVDIDKVEYPVVNVGEYIVYTNAGLSCMAMHYDAEGAEKNCELRVEN